MPALTIACLFAARGLALVLATSRQRARAWWVACAIRPVLVWSAVDLARAIGRRNDLQLERLRFVYAHTGPADPVLDGWLGTAVFRPSPAYYFFMHRELQVSLSEREKDAYFDALERARPPLITLDDELRALGPRFLDFLRRNYVSDDGLFYRPVTPARLPIDRQ